MRTPFVFNNSLKSNSVGRVASQTPRTLPTTWPLDEPKDCQPSATFIIEPAK
jgi:hypothetical protein